MKFLLFVFLLGCGHTETPKSFSQNILDLEATIKLLDRRLEAMEAAVEELYKNDCEFD